MTWERDSELSSSTERMCSDMNISRVHVDGCFVVLVVIFTKCLASNNHRLENYFALVLLLCPEKQSKTWQAKLQKRFFLYHLEHLLHSCLESSALKLEVKGIEDD